MKTIVEARKRCLNECGFDKSATASVEGNDLPNMIRLLKQRLESGVLSQADHEHETEITYRVTSGLGEQE